MDKEFQHKLAQIMKNNDWHLGIGDVATATGVSQTKLRYWESKGYIESIQGKGQNRKFTYSMLMKVYQMKLLLDQGYTLSVAAQKAESKSHELKLLKQVLFDRFEGMATIDGQPAVNLGYLDDNDKKSILYAVVSKEGTKFKVVPAENKI
ncbi:MerR family transcriptional regulator [Lentilactobacillus kefiri]|uniref:Regulatory protein MerR n=3 Tax=Lentilactobacillus kefiri TaxID=33962 RepID=A0A8E1RJ70_LENKE|nr:MerR family transcriptional regulator [Lentilactobacillus kefiri]KRL69280.1 regulatory protein MerR [Lentilactobacillus parakefiri DSM 10551]KRM51447.1 regulatory protein MerR [Lentilactobacillus kefiri DSM 20587 = JCM 5818]MCJ2162142.1 MerR family transcriptional regulator [Lentilactobacillus kefiri]MCP9369308.1 MerR family transcriptional regulator [Lentilactobacillus kefiri]MDH5108770.1 MerR family transcriptional regulator [Lentilactobacillus kefiri]